MKDSRWYHFTPKPPIHLMTREQRIIERMHVAHEGMYTAYYTMFFIVFCIIWLLISYVRATPQPTLYDQICDTVSHSPLCKYPSLYKKLDIMSKDHGVPTELVVGIAYAESHIGTNYASGKCTEYHNWWGLKWYKKDNGDVEWFTGEKWPDANWCWLYKFEDIEEAFNGILNTISMWYKACKNDTRCISYNFVWRPNIAEESWINNVSKFYTINE